MTSAVEATVQPSSTPAPTTSLGQASIHVERGRAFLTQGLPEPAIAEFNRAIALNPENVEAYASRGFARIKLGQFEQGIADYDQAIELAPDHPMLYNDRGFAYAEQGQFERAILDYTQAIELDPHHSHIDYAYNNRGFAYGNLEKYEQAFRDFDRAVELNPGNAWIYFNRALIRVQRGESIPAIRDLERSLELDNPPLNPERRNKAEELLEQLQNWGSEA
jgi:tetratricopeptide (TPR) repeat protein